ncbi:MAG: HEAT repeat domain-containing protein [Anaerolineae bacterium]|nr:HEAT repeat domain-containing protein [Anaerolineae bacterium]
MNTTLIVIGFVIVVLVVSGGVVFLILYNYADISYLKSKQQTAEIIKIFKNASLDVRKRRQALSALVELATPDALKTLTASLGKLQGELQTQLVSELPKAGKSLVPYLTAALRDAPARPDALQVIKALGQDAAEALFPLLSDPNPTLRTLAAQTLDEIGWQPTRDALSAAYWMIKKQPHRCAAIGVAAIPVLVQALNDPELCEPVIEALGEIHHPDVIRPLLKAGKNPQYALKAGMAIGKLGETAVPVLLEIIQNPAEEEIRQMASNALDLVQWTPAADQQGARYWALKRRWDKCLEIGENAIVPLIESLQREPPQTRKEIIHVLGKISSEKALPELLNSINDRDHETRIAAVEALGYFKHQSAVEALVASLSDDSLHPAHINALARIGEAAHDALVTALYPPNTTTRLRAAEALAKTGWSPHNDETAAAYAIALQDWESCAKLGEAAIDRLLEDLHHPQTCSNAARALAQIGEARAIVPIIQAFAAKPPAVQQTMVEALAHFGNTAIPPLLEALNSGQMELLPVIHTLGLIGDERAARPLANFLSSDYPSSVRETAAQALGNIGLPALKPILERLREGNIHPRAAGEALGRIGKPARDQIIQALRSKIYDAQTLVYALGKIPDETAAAAVVETLVSGQYGQEIRNTAVNALLEIGPASIKPLIATLGSSLSNQPEIYNVLVKFGSDAVEPLIWALQYYNNPFQCEAIVNILGDIGDVRAVNPLMTARKKYGINNEIVKTALEKIWRKQH